MANTIIKIKRGLGTPTSLAAGELAIDITNKNLFVGDDSSVPFIIGGEGTFATKSYADGIVSTANTNLQSAINTEKARIDAILSAADADKDSFAEIVSLINSVDASNDSAFAGYVTSNNAALAQEVSDRTAADTTLQSNIDAEETRAMAAEAVNAAAIAQEVTDRTADVNAEETRALAAEATLTSNLSAEVARATAAELANDSAITAEVARATAAESALSARVTALETTIDGGTY